LKRNLLLIVSFIAFVLVVSACGNDEKSESPSNESNSNTGDENESVTEDVELSLGHYRVTDTELDKLFSDTVEKFEDEHPEVTFEENAVAHDPYRTRMTTLGASGELPDIFMANGSMLIDYIAKDYVMPWNDILDEDEEWRDGFVNNAFDDFTTIDGDIFGVPVQMQAVHTVYYNQDIFDEVGIADFPETMSELYDAIDKLNEADYTPIVMGNKPNWPFGSTLFSTLADRVTGPEWFQGLETGESKFTDQEFIDVLNIVKDLVDMEAFNADINSIDPEQAANIYFEEEAAMMVIGPWGVRDYFADAPEEIVDATSLALLPDVEDGKGNAQAVAGGGGWSYAVNSDLEGKEKELAIEFIKMLTNDEFASAMMENNDMPMRTVPLTESDGVSPLQLEYFEMVEDVEFTPVYDIRLEPAVVESLYRGLQDLLIGSITPEELAETVQNNVGE